MTERAIFEAAAEIKDSAKRAAFLDEACAGDAALRTRIGALLSSHENASQFLNMPVVEQIKSSAIDAHSATMALPKADGANAHPDDDSDDELAAAPDISYLRPSSKPGSIGTLGHYEIVQVLGQGAFGVVFKAFDETLHRLVAIKVMSSQMAATSPPRKRFLREARSAAAIKHENIVQVYSVEEQPLPYLVMEFVDGLTLKQTLDGSGPLDVPEILHLGRQMASGLAAAHAQGLIHRDIKPGNILIEAGAEQKVKITDFGLARAADDASMTRTGLISGTPMYMAPEQAMGTAFDHRADLFSLGSVLYQMVCGRPPFRASNAIAVLKRVIDETPRPIQEIIPEVPAWLCEIIAKLHAKQPADRFQSAKEVADLLARCQSELQLNGQVTCVVVPVAESVRDSKKADHLPATTGPANTQASRAALAPGRFESNDQVRGLTPSGSPILTQTRSPILSRTGLVVAAAIVLILAAAIVFQRANHTTPANLASRAASAPGQAESINSTDSDRRAAEWVLSIGGTIIVKENGSKRPIGVSGELSPGAFELTSVDLQHNLQVTDAELFRFQDCKNIEALGLSGTNVSDAGLGHFKDCKNLTSLQLESTRVSDAGLEYFKDCNNLTSLELNSSPVSDAGLVHFEDCKNLTYLGLGSTQVTDAGLKRLAAYPKLSHLRIQKAKVTAAGVKKLSAALPACKIEWDGGVIEPRTVWHGSAWDDLDPAQIPAAERVPRQPEGLVAVLGQHRRRVWSRPLSAAVSPDGNQYLLGTDDGLYLFDRDLKKPMRDLHPFIAESTATFLPDGRIAAFGQVAGKSSTQLQIFAKPRDNVPLEVESSTATNTVTGYRVPTASSDGRWLGVFDQGPSGSFELWKLNDALPQRAAKFTRHGLDNWLKVCFSPDANWFCYTDGNGAQSTIHLIDLRGDAPREAAVLKAEADEKSDAPAKGFYHAVFLADGRLATADRNGRTWFWKINDGEPQRVGSIRDAEVGEFLAASAKASRLVVSDGYTFRVWDLAVDPPKLLGTSSHSFPNDNIQNAAIAPDGNTVFTAHLNGAIRFWNVAPAGVTELDPLLPNPKRNDGLGQFKVLDRFLCSSTETQEVGVWQPTPTGLQSVSEPPPGHFLLGLLGKNSKQQQLIVLEPGGTGTLLFRREADQWKTIRRINGAGVHSAALNDDGRRIAIGRNNGTEFVVELWGWESEKQPARKLHEIKADSDFSLSQFAFAQEDRSLVVRHGFNVEVWDVQDDQLVPRTKLPPRQFHQIAVAPDGHTLATTASAFAAGHKLELWNLTTDLQQPTASFSLPNAEAVTFSPDGRRLAASFQESGTSAGVQIIQLATGTVEQRLTFPGAVHQLDFADDNRHLITANANGTIYVVRLAPPK